MLQPKRILQPRLPTRVTAYVHVHPAAVYRYDVFEVKTTPLIVSQFSNSDWQ
jgi:hypothetical protein